MLYHVQRIEPTLNYENHDGGRRCTDSLKVSEEDKGRKTKMGASKIEAVPGRKPSIYGVD